MKYYLLILLTFFTFPAWAYIDPGVGSMLFQAAVAGVLTFFMFFRGLFTAKLKTLFKKDQKTKDKINQNEDQ